MGTPQQPEIRRSGHSAVDQDHASEVAGEKPRTRQRKRAEPGPVPPESEPGHHPISEQDKPAEPGVPPKPRRRRRRPEPGAGGAHAERFPFEFDPRLAPLAAVVGVVPSTAYVEVDGGDLRIRFGPWLLSTPLDNVRDVTATGPYHWWKIAGPPRLSLVDRGITFATTAAGGTCISFHEPVPAALPISWLRHPSATVTVASPAALAQAVVSSSPD